MGPKRRDFIFGCLSATVASLGPSTVLGPSSAKEPEHDILNLSATEVLGLFASGALTSERYCKALLAQCRCHQSLNAFT